MTLTFLPSFYNFVQRHGKNFAPSTTSRPRISCDAVGDFLVGNPCHSVAKVVHTTTFFTEQTFVGPISYFIHNMISSFISPHE